MSTSVRHPDSQTKPVSARKWSDRFESPAFVRAGQIFVAVLATLTVLYTFAYLKLSQTIDHRLAYGAFGDSVNIYSAPLAVAVGDPLTAAQVVTRLRHSGYSTSRGNDEGWYNERPDAVEIFPGRDSYMAGDAAVLRFAAGKLTGITSLADNTSRNQYDLEPQFLANLSENHEKRRLVRFGNIPRPLLQAVISAEDKRFFHHSGFDLFRVLKAAYVDLRDRRKEQGASTLSMQLARSLWLAPEKRWTRKLEEVMITLHLEETLSKEQIFEDYANQVYLGRRGPFSIHGFGEGARVYFGKDLRELNIAEAATLAGMIQRPSYFNPYRSPDETRERRDVVLGLMRQNGYLNESDYRAALHTPLRLSTDRSEGLEASYFVDVMNDELQSKLDDRERTAHYVYTTLDPTLQSTAEQAVRIGMQNVDRQLRGRKQSGAIREGQPQVALVALNPHTGEIKALVGGRSYSASQLNHAQAKRQPGSSFKPFVYAAALETAISGGTQIFTPASILNDSPATFRFANQAYAPDNFHHEFMGEVTLRTALAHSLNVATVKLAQQVGYARVVAVAKRAGLSDAIQPTPAMALGAYEDTPLEVAGAYTVFANGGKHVAPTTVSLVRSHGGELIYQHEPNPQAALDPRVAYLMTNLMQEVLRSGTGAGVAARGFTLPAAGKTGTSRDGWFAGYTSELLTVVWVGFDDNRELGLEGAKSALPIWAEFMKRAAELRPYRGAQPFHAPSGVTTVEICPMSGQLAGPYCPRTYSEVFVNGTQPVVECQMHSPEVLNPQQMADRVVDPGPANPAILHGSAAGANTTLPRPPANKPAQQ